MRALIHFFNISHSVILFIYCFNILPFHLFEVNLNVKSAIHTEGRMVEILYICMQETVRL